ncbi:uncharacterized protein MYCFIDRAFT_80126 [Pseudocercospora fijiensis CIRAD86]|uniref:N-acetyltransferase domain-containing protein n=1 Tax=Pseudocercospora fijiensis (strain CIRAD86) TaxID=383855 RepID=N1QBV2_PSEFD|nr:uncharacterized protein MYCFIDRAFT_80126 [Pseudocercospora fijiensis CIRAD86]EME88752.1 hypothetical protein MYCFIDRAFT_80126 [Pseudocercospora fijiensis CIRAD86]
MRRWTARGLRPAASRVWQWPSSRLPARRGALSPFHTAAPRPAPLGTIRIRRHGDSVFEKISRPERTIDAWAALIDGALPPHLRDPQVTPPASTLSAGEVAEILWAAQYPRNRDDEAFDILYHLGIHQNRWNAVVWLIKKLVDKFPARHGRSPKYAHMSSAWQSADRSLADLTDRMTNGPVNVELPGVSPGPGSSRRPTLDELTVTKENTMPLEVIAHNALGQVWRTLGAMTQACTGSEIRSEVLEIIAYLHHQEVMPMSIYQANANPDKSTIQQPPLLPLLSSRILTSLSDAAWRAHQKLVIEEAKATGSEFSSLRPELLGSAYRVNVAGLRPEVWMELILWSCLHGGWIRQGVEILQALVKSRQWKPLSWAQYEKQLPPEAATTSKEWSAWEYLFKTRSTSSMDAPPEPKQSIERTISGELVSAYIDAVATSADVGVGTRGMQIDEVVTVLAELKWFLLQSRQNLSFGTWESVIIRLLELGSITPEHDHVLLRSAIYSSAGGGFGQSLYGSNTNDLPAYVLDGTAASLGLLHRSLRGQISANNLESALEVFSMIQKLTDLDKSRSVTTFFGTDRENLLGKNIKPPKPASSLFRSLQQHGLFTSNLSSIDYPTFNVQIPPNILGPFLELVCDAEAFDFGHWLLYSTDIDGPVIPVSLYDDPFVQPGIVRLAAETDDKVLLENLKQLKLSRRSMRSIISTQFRMYRWDAATRVLSHLATTRGSKWDMTNLAQLIRHVLVLARQSESGDPESQQHLDRAKHIMTDMLALRYHGWSTIEQERLIPMQSVLTVLAAVDQSWARFCSGIRVYRGHHDLHLETRDFNIILDGVVKAYGSRAGRHLLDIFWPHAVRRSIDAGVVFTRHRRAKKQVPRFRPEIMASIKRQRIVVNIDGSRAGDLVVYGAVIPNAGTVFTILGKALEEFEAAGFDEARSSQEIHADPPSDADSERDLTPTGMVEWAVRRLAELPDVEASVVDKLDRFLAKYGLEHVRQRLPEVYRMVDEEQLYDDNHDGEDTCGENAVQDGIALDESIATAKFRAKYFSFKASIVPRQATPKLSRPIQKTENMKISILPAIEKDIPSLVHIELEAFRSHPRIPILWPNGYQPDVYTFYSSRKLQELHDPNTHLLKAIDEETGQIVGASEIKFCLDPEKNATEISPLSKGIGSKLIQWSMNEADRWGVPLALESTPKGLALYGKSGFVEVERILVDMKMFGWEEDTKDINSKSLCR